MKPEPLASSGSCRPGCSNWRKKSSRPGGTRCCPRGCRASRGSRSASIETTAGVTSAAILLKALLTSASGFTSAFSGRVSRCWAWESGVRSKPAAKTRPAANAIADAPRMRARKNVRAMAIYQKVGGRSYVHASDAASFRRRRRDPRGALSGSTPEPPPGLPRSPARCARTLLLVLVHDLVVGLDHVVGASGGRSRRLRAGRRALRLTGRRALLLLGVERLAGLLEGPGQLFLRRADLPHVVASQRLSGALDGRLQLLLELRREP